MFKYINNKFTEVLELDDLFTQIKDRIQTLEDKNQALRQENAKLKSDKYAEDELSSMQAELNEMKENYYRGFPVSAEQAQNLRAWQVKHRYDHHNGKSPSTAIGGEWEYRFLPTSIGIAGSCLCISCMRKATDNFYNYPSRSRTSDLRSKLIKKYDAEFIFQELQ